VQDAELLQQALFLKPLGKSTVVPSTDAIQVFGHAVQLRALGSN